MSNFICSECGMTNIDCGRDGYKTPKEIELEKKVHILNEANMKLENELGHFAENKKLKDRLDNAHRTLCEVLRMSLSDEKDISKIYDIVKPTIEKLNQLLI